MPRRSPDLRGFFALLQSEAMGFIIGNGNLPHLSQLRAIMIFTAVGGKRMDKRKTLLMDAAFTVVTLAVTFILNLLLQQWFQTRH